MTQEKSNNSNTMKAYSVRLDKQTVDFINSFSQAVAIQTGSTENFSSTLRFLVRRQSNLNVKPTFAKLSQDDQAYLQNFVSTMENNMDLIKQTEQGIGVNLNQLARMANTQQVPASFVKYLDDMNKQHLEMMSDFDQINTRLRQIKMILNLETLVQDTVQMQKEAQNNQTQDTQTQTQAPRSNLQPTDLPQDVQSQGDPNARNIDN